MNEAAFILNFPFQYTELSKTFTIGTPNPKEKILQLKHLYTADVINWFNPFENQPNAKSITMVISSDQIISCLEI